MVKIDRNVHENGWRRRAGFVNWRKTIFSWISNANKREEIQLQMRTTSGHVNRATMEKKITTIARTNVMSETC